MDYDLIGLMVYTFERDTAITALRVKDHFPKGLRIFIRLHEKGGRCHEVPIHHKVEEFLDAYIEAARIAEEKNLSLFRNAGVRGCRHSKGCGNRFDMYEIMRWRAKELGVKDNRIPHPFGETGIIAYF